LLAHRSGEFAFVTTNSITQGQPVPALFMPLFREGWAIKFAHRTFAWDSEAPGKAAVHCVIVGFSRDKTISPRLWDYKSPKGHPEAQKVEIWINPYLIDAPDVLVESRTSPLSSELQPMRFGSIPGNTKQFVFKSGKPLAEIDIDPVARKYLRPFVGAKELINNTERWCLWLKDLTREDLQQSTYLQKILKTVESIREKSSRPATLEAANTPGLFLEIRQPDVPYLCAPRHVTEHRLYWTAARYQPDIIAGDSNLITPDESGIQFAFISSSMFITWQKSIGGRLESRYRLSSTLTWNTFPVPELDEHSRQRIIQKGKQILDARGLFPEQTLADLYDPFLMGANKALKKAHDDLDREVDKAFGATRRLTTDKQRLELLFPAYERLIAG